MNNYYFTAELRLSTGSDYDHNLGTFKPSKYGRWAVKNPNGKFIDIYSNEFEKLLYLTNDSKLHYYINIIDLECYFDLSDSDIEEIIEEFSENYGDNYDLSETQLKEYFKDYLNDFYLNCGNFSYTTNFSSLYEFDDYLNEVNNYWDLDDWCNNFDDYLYVTV